MTPSLSRSARATFLSLALALPALPALGVVGVVGVVGTAGCATSGPECSRGADCASGACSATGRCMPPGDVDATTDATTAVDTDAGADASEPLEAGPVGDAGCVPNKDFRITREEVPLAAGLRATYKVAKDADIATAGTPLGDGTRSWDLSAELPGDALALVETQRVEGKWFAADFAGASYATKLSARSELLGVFELSPGALKLRGVVSPADGVTRTNVAYSPAVDVLAFPLEMGKAFTTTSTVTGLASGVFSTYSEKYDSAVDARGTLKTPLGTFTVLRVRTTLTRTVGLLVTVVRSFAWVTECYGTVATATSADNEANAEFTRASEVRRISP